MGMKHRFKAFATHFGLSALVLAGCMVVIFGFWYPDPYYRILGAGHILLVLAGVQLLLGPSLTFLVYAPGKKNLKFDLSVIVIIQLVALVYGMHAIHSERPWFMVFAVDRFNVLAAKDVDFEAIHDPRFLAKPWRGPLMLVANLPEDPAERQRLMEETLFQGKPDVERRPEYWSVYAEGWSQARSASKGLQYLQQARPEASEAIAATAAAAGVDANALRFLPVMGKQSDFAVVLDPEDGAIIDIIDVNPWLE